jgi:hypothetical protein
MILARRRVNVEAESISQFIVCGCSFENSVMGDALFSIRRFKVFCVWLIGYVKLQLSICWFFVVWLRLFYQVYGEPVFKKREK